MPFIDNVKIDNLQQMMMECFWGKKGCLKSILERKVNMPVIQEALDCGYIELLKYSDEEIYRTTPKGEAYLK